MKRQAETGRSSNDWFPQAGPWFDVFCVTAAVVLLGVIMRRGIEVDVAWMVPLFVLAFEAVDLLVGVVHWALDKYWRYDTPVVGNLVHTFRGHHPDPKELCSHSYIETNNDTYPIVVLVALLVVLIARSPGVNWFMFWLLVISANSATIHQWAHLDNPPRIVRALQRLEILVPASNHIRHHDGYMSHYCAISGHLNYVTDKLGLWRKLEWLIQRTTGVKPFHALPPELQRE